jgi:Leucine-rich repeat (LRR) protein
MFLFVSCEDDRYDTFFIEDSVLRACINAEGDVNKDGEKLFYRYSLEEVKKLTCLGKIRNTHGLENLVNLEYLEIQNNYSTEPFIEIGKLKKLKELRINSFRELEILLNLKDNLTDLVLISSPLRDLTPLESLNLKRLAYFFAGDDEISTQLQSISKMTTLEQLFLGGNNITDIEFVRNLKNLKILYLDHNDISDLTPLEELSNLEDLSLEFTDVEDLTPLKNLLNLRQLDLNGAQKIKDLTPLLNLTKMNAIQFIYTEVESLDGLDNMENLEILLASKNKIKDISALSNLRNLLDVELYENEIADLTPLKNSTKMIYLDLYHNWEAAHGEALKDMVDLEYLRIDRTSIRTFSFLKNLTKLTEIDYTENLITNIDGIENIPPNITKLVLDHNLIFDITPFSRLENRRFEFISLMRNYISDFSSLEDLSIYKLMVETNCIPTSDVDYVRSLATFVYYVDSQRSVCEVVYDECRDSVDCKDNTDGNIKCISRGICTTENYCNIPDDCKDNQNGKTWCYMDGNICVYPPLGCDSDIDCEDNISGETTCMEGTCSMSCDSDTDCENAVDGKTKCLSRGFCKYENYCLSNEDCEDNPEGKTKCYDYACVEP